jgi:hypothetical protein
MVYRKILKLIMDHVLMGMTLKIHGLGIEWKTSTPLWPQGNGNAESVMKPLGKVIKTSMLEGKN